MISRNQIHLYVATLVTLVIATLPGSTAQARSIFVNDLSFGKSGLVTNQLGPADLVSIVGSKSLIKDHRGRIIAGAANDNGWQVRRYFPDGKLDPSFGDEGEVVIKDWGGIDNIETRANLTSAALRPDGRILLVGFVRSVSGRKPGLSYMVIKQLLPDGSPDISFGQENGGSSVGALMGAASVALLPDGRFLVAGFDESQFGGPGASGLMIRMTADGERDFSFGGYTGLIIPGDGRKSSYLLDVEVLPSGRILAAGAKANRFLVIKLRKNGSYVRSFGKRGRAVFGPGGKKCRCSLGRGMDRDRKGRIVVTGVVRAPTFDKAGYGATVRFKKGGKLDRSFGNKGVARIYATKRTGHRTTELYDNAVDSKGGIWATGSAGPEFTGNRKAVTVRYLPNGKKDKRFFRKGKLIIRMGESGSGWQTFSAGRRVYLLGRYNLKGKERLFLKRFVLRRHFTGRG